LAGIQPTTHAIEEARVKKTRILLAVGLMMALATPALAEVKFSGFYRLMGISGELKDVDTQSGDSQQLIDQRFRAQVTNTLNDNVSITYQAEIDTVWGGSVPAGGGNGGAFDTDGINVETKHIYLDLKQGDTSARIGLQTYGDEFQGLVGFADMAGITVKHKIGGTSIGLLYSKWDENDGDGHQDEDFNKSGAITTADYNASGIYSDWDDTDFYGVTVQQKISDTFKVGAAIYYLDSNDVTDVRANIVTGLSGTDRVAYTDHADGEVWYYGLTADAKFGDFGVDGFLLYQRGSVDFDANGDDTVAPRTAIATPKKDQSSQAWAASVKGTMKLANGNVGLRGIYITDDESNNDNEYWLGSFGEYDFVNENQMIFLTDKFVCNYTKERYAMQDAARAGYGLMALVLSGNHTLPSDMYVNWGLGYYNALDNERNDQMTGVKGTKTWQNVRTNGKNLGWEADLRVGKKFFEKVDVSLNMAYADFGSFYNDTTEENDHNIGDGVSRNSNSPDSVYKTYLMVNVPF
jgi:hypothetical protein